jgi:HTH-type transcriptional regulator / antitoxin HigA
MNEHGYAFDPDYSYAPGETLADYLSDFHMSQAELARRAGLSVKHVNQIVQGQASITASTAVLLERVTGISASVWSQLEANFQVARGRNEEEQRLKEDVTWLAAFPVGELKKRKYLTAGVTETQQLRELLDFFQVASPAAWNQVWATPTAYRLSPSLKPDFGALATWIRIGELQSKGIDPLPAFSREHFQSLLPKIRELTRLTEGSEAVSKLIDLCASAGVAVVVEREIKGARINGVVRWLPSGNPLVILSMRHRWADIFWFTFFHEVGHIILHDRKKPTFIDAPISGSRTSVLEVEADNFASETLIPKELDRLLTDAYDAASISNVAQQVGVHPGTVVGRMQHDGLIPFSQFNDLRVRFQPV